MQTYKVGSFPLFTMTEDPTLLFACCMNNILGKFHKIQFDDYVYYFEDEKRKITRNEKAQKGHVFLVNLKDTRRN